MPTRTHEISRLTRTPTVAEIWRMGKIDLMKDPFYAQLMFVIESAICKADKVAEEKGLRLTDSNIKSALNKAGRITPRMVTNTNESVETREDIINELTLSIAANRELLTEENHTASGTTKKEVSHADWAKAIAAVEASLKVRRSDEPGGREYLNYIRRFIEVGRI